MISVYSTVVGVSEAKDTAIVVCVTLLRLPWPCFASIETTRLNNRYKGREPGRPPRLSHSSLVLTRVVQCCFTSTETVRTVRDGESKMATWTFAQLLL